MNKIVQLETSGGNGLESTTVEDLLVLLEHMSAGRYKSRTGLNQIAYNNGSYSYSNDRSELIRSDLCTCVMSADSLNFWLCNFTCEVEKQTGERYPPKMLYVLGCGINRHLGNVQGEKAFNTLEKSYRR